MDIHCARSFRQYLKCLASVRGRSTAKARPLAALASLAALAAACTQSPAPSATPDAAGAAATDPNLPAGGKVPPGATAPGAAATPGAATATGAGTVAGAPPAGTTPPAAATAPAGEGGAPAAGGRRAHPEWVQKRIEAFQGAPVDNPPRTIMRYDYKGQAVFYVSAPCCDFQGELYDAQGALICHPDGGVTGRGDGKCPDFATTKSNPITVWQDARKPTGRPGPKAGGAGGSTPAPPRGTQTPPPMPTVKPAPTM